MVTERNVDSSIRSLDLTSYKIVKELFKNAKPSGAMTQWFLVIAKSTFNEERKPLVIDNSWCDLVLSEKVVTGRKQPHSINLTHDSQ